MTLFCALTVLWVFQSLKGSKTTSKLCYVRRSVGQSVLVSSIHLGTKTRFLLLSDNCGFVDVGRSLSDERTDLSFTIAACPRQRSHSWVRVPRHYDHILLPQIRDSPQPGGPGSHIYIPQEQVGPIIPPGTGFPFHRLLLLTGLRWRYSNSPPRGDLEGFGWWPRHTYNFGIDSETSLPRIPSLLSHVFVAAENYFSGHYLATSVPSGSTILAFSHYVTILLRQTKQDRLDGRYMYRGSHIGRIRTKCWS
jgi:hypothetical protein